MEEKGNSFETLENPFTWRLLESVKMDKDFNDRDIGEFLSEREEYFKDGDDYIRTICVKLLLAHDKATKSKGKDGLMELKECMQIVNEQIQKIVSIPLKSEKEFIPGKDYLHEILRMCSIEQDPLSLKEGYSQDDFDRLNALKYVVLGSIACLVAESGEKGISHELCKAIKKGYEIKSKVFCATVMAVKAQNISEFGVAGERLALPLFRKVVELDPNNGYWYLCCGKMLRRLYKYSSMKDEIDPSGMEQIQMLEKAVELLPHSAPAKYHLANAYHKIGFRRRRDITNYAALLDKAKNLYIDALKWANDCPYTNARCASGLFSLPDRWSDLNTAEKAVKRAVELAPNDNLVNHTAGQFYEKQKDYEKALQYYTEAVNAPSLNTRAELNLINVKLIIIHSSDVSLREKLIDINFVDHIKKAIEKYSGAMAKADLWFILGMYYAKLVGNTAEALKCYMQAIRLSPDSKSYFVGSFLSGIASGYVSVDEPLEKVLTTLKNCGEYGRNEDLVEEALKFLSRNKLAAHKYQENKFINKRRSEKMSGKQSWRAGSSNSWRK